MLTLGRSAPSLLSKRFTFSFFRIIITDRFLSITSTMILTYVPWLAASAIAGVAAHYSLFIRGEWHLYVPKIVFGHMALACVVWSLMPNVSHHPADHLRVCLSMFVCYLGFLFSSITIYRLFFHRLRRFPGPKLAAVTKFWHVFAARSSTNYLVMQKLHEKYGKLVRTGELSYAMIKAPI